MEIFGFIGALIGIVAAIINRKRIIILRYEYGRSSSSYVADHGVTIRKRFKRFVLAVLIAFSIPFCVGIFLGAQGQSTESEDVTKVLMWPFGIFLLVAAYQFLAMIVLVFAKLWR